MQLLIERILDLFEYYQATDNILLNLDEMPPCCFDLNLNTWFSIFLSNGIKYYIQIYRHE